MTSFTDMVTNIKNHKNHKFGLKWPECLVLLLLQLICIKKYKLSKIPKILKLAIFHVACVVLLDGLKHMGHGRGTGRSG